MIQRDYIWYFVMVVVFDGWLALLSCHLSLSVKEFCSHPNCAPVAWCSAEWFRIRRTSSYRLLLFLHVFLLQTNGYDSCHISIKVTYWMSFSALWEAVEIVGVSANCSSKYHDINFCLLVVRFHLFTLSFVGINFRRNSLATIERPDVIGSMGLVLYSMRCLRGAGAPSWHLPPSHA